MPDVSESFHSQCGFSFGETRCAACHHPLGLGGGYYVYGVPYHMSCYYRKRQEQAGENMIEFSLSMEMRPWQELIALALLVGISFWCGWKIRAEIEEGK